MGKVADMSVVNNLTEWLSSLSHVVRATGGSLDINGRLYPAVEYFQKYKGPEGCRNPEERIERFIYVLGRYVPRKAPFSRRGESVLALQGEPEEWYVACHADAKRAILPEHRRYAPFGHFFIVCPWSAEFGKIDTGKRKPYVRVPAAFRVSM
jgi:hypothetical protein